MLAWLQQLYWREPLWLCLALQPLLLLGMRSLRRRQRLRAYAEPALQPWVIQTEHKPLLQRLLSRDMAYVLGWLLLAIAAAGPRLPLPGSATQQFTALNLMIVIDNSRSMSVNDTQPSRIRRARLEIGELLTQAAGNRIGMITFAARPHLYVPLTSDYGALRSYLSILDELVLPTSGSHIEAALTMAHRELSPVTGQRAILLITDGDLGEQDDQQRQQLFDTVRQLAEDDMPLYVLGVGSVEGDAIPLVGGGWLTANARPIISRLNEELLETLAELGTGRYSVAYDDNSDWQSLYARGLKTLIKANDAAQDDRDRQWQEFYSWFLLPGMVLLYFSLYPYRWQRRLVTATPALLLGIGLVMALAQEQASAAQPGRIEDRAYSLYQQGAYREAAREYAQLDTFAGRLGEGASLYRQGDYAAAIQQYSAAVLYAETNSKRAMALYNLGNSYFRTGDYETAIRVYRDALQYRPDHAQTQHNLGFSQAVQEEVNKRVRESVIAQRAGSGPRSARAETGTDVSQSSRVALDDSGEEGGAALPPAALADIDTNALEALIQRGLEHVEVAGGTVEDTGTGIQAEPGPGQADIRLQTQVIQDKQPRLWKRIFEIEEDFPAELDAPQPARGLSPW